LKRNETYDKLNITTCAAKTMGEHTSSQSDH